MILLTIVITVGLSRVALGVHSFNQIIYGWSYGLWLALFLFRYALPPLQSHIRQLYENRPIMKKYMSYYFSVGLVIWLGVIAVSIFNYLLAKRDFPNPPPQLWLDNMLAKCGLVYKENSMFVNPGFIKTGGISVIFGAYFGILYDASHGQSSLINP